MHYYIFNIYFILEADKLFRWPSLVGEISQINAKWALFHLYNDENKLVLDDILMMSTLY
jgi:hypothetical protein